MIKQLPDKRFSVTLVGLDRNYYGRKIYNTYEEALEEWNFLNIDNECGENRLPRLIILDIMKSKNIKLQRQANIYCCLATSFAMLLDIEQTAIFSMLKHDGSKIIFPKRKGMKKYRGFHIQEMIDLCYNLGYAVIGVEALPTLNTESGKSKGVSLYTENEAEVKMIKYLTGNRGVITGETLSGNRHSVAWNGQEIFDPDGTIYKLTNNFILETFWLVKKINQIY